MSWTRRAVIAGTAAGALLLTGGVAVAQESTEPSPVTITLSQEQVTWLCEKRLPKIERRANRLVERITGDANTQGSAEWLRAKAQSERDAGRETSAQLLEERADRRAGRVDELSQIRQWAADFRTEHCESK
jgi:hypothetical protein